MDDYVKKFGFSPQEMGLDDFMRTTRPAGVNVRAEREPLKSNESRHTAENKTNNFDNTMLKDLPLAMAYVPFQPLAGTYEQDEALKAGTLFPNLDKPFLGRRM